MKKLSCLTLLGATLFTFSCRDDAPSADHYALPDKFSSKTVEENKAQLEDNGIKLVNSLEGLKDSKGIDASANLINLFNSMGQTEVAPGGRILSSLTNLRTDTKSASKIFSAMRLTSEEPESIKAFMDANAGTYSWQTATQEWDTVATGGTSIVFQFPAVEGGSTNNAILTIGDYQGEPATIDGEATDLPKNLAMNLAVDGAKVVEYSFKATYNASQDPTSMVSTLTLAPYVFEVNFSNTTTNVEANYSLKNGSETLIAMGASSTGKYSIDAIEASEGDDIVENASAYFQVYNIKVAGNVDMKSIVAGREQIYPDNYWSDTSFNYDAATVKEAELFNKHYKLMVFYVDSKEKIADTEFYTYTDTYSYSYWVDTDGDGYGDKEETYTETDTDMDIRLIFADETKANFETYFATGFGEMEAELESFRSGF